MRDRNKTKNPQEIMRMRQSAALLSQVHGEVAKHVAEGVPTQYLNEIAEKFITSHGALPSFKGHEGFPAALCTSINEEALHGVPGRRKLVAGDILSVDCGVYYQGYHSDSAFTYPIGAISEKILHLLALSEQALELGIKQVCAGKRIGDIGFAIQQAVEKHGYTLLEGYGGHGIGKRLHEWPDIPNVGACGKGPKLVNGMVMAIEPIVCMGAGEVVVSKKDGVISTKDRRPAAHFEHTLAIVDGKAELLTSFKYIKEALTR